ncbi:MAG: hypothetical protein KAQ99_06280 [Candidatus Aureabacteria bacterium]|nr:hypothetical protein [Candidatus Auribacterota bacterium]
MGKRIKIVRNNKALTIQNRIYSGIKISLAIVLILGFIGTVFAKDKEKKEKVVKIASGVVSGEISGISEKFISVVYEKDKEKGIEYETLVPIDKDVKIEHKKSLSELKIGDRVSIRYEDATVEDSDKRQTLKRKATVIRFVRSAVKTPEPAHPPEPGEGLPDDY